MGGWNSTRSVEGWTGGRGDGSKKTQIFFFFEFVCVYSSSLTCEDFKWVPKYIYYINVYIVHSGPKIFWIEG